MGERIIPPRVKTSREDIVAVYDSFAPVYAGVTVWEEEAREVVVEKAGIRDGYRVLDSGCGPGTIVLQAAERVGPSGEVCGVDLSEKMLEQTMKRARDAGLQDRILLRRADLYETLPFEQDYFDVVISTYVFDLIDTPDLPKVLRGLVRVLKPGGRIVLGSWTFGEGSHKISSDLYVELYEKIRVDYACRPVHLQPCMEELKLRDVGRQYIGHVMSPEEASLRGCLRMRRLVRVIIIVVVVGVVGSLAALLGGRFSDGPLEVIPGVPGGPLLGEVERGPEPDWSFARDVDPIELQISSSPPRSIFTGVVVHEDALYVPVTLAPLKRWPDVVRSDPRVRVRIEGRLFERRALPVTDPELIEELIAAGRSKYGAPFHATWAARFTHYFRLDPLPPGGDG
jgi:ubiquinone/menaquinone biosynthesis C-methylase UbiE